MLLFFAIVIALFGIANTLGLSIIERRHELGLLRAVGMTRRQLRSSVRWESVIIALLGTLLGLVIGVVFAWAMVSALSDQGIDKFSVAPAQLAAHRDPRRPVRRPRGRVAGPAGSQARRAGVDQQLTDAVGAHL